MIFKLITITVSFIVFETALVDRPSEICIVTCVNPASETTRSAIFCALALKFTPEFASLSDLERFFA